MPKLCHAFILSLAVVLPSCVPAASLPIEPSSFCNRTDVVSLLQSKSLLNKRSRAEAEDLFEASPPFTDAIYDWDPAHGDTIYDLFGQPIKQDAVYHATIKVGMGDAAAIIEMSPEPTIQMAKHAGQEEIKPGQQYEMFVADKTNAFAASAFPDHVYSSDLFRLGSKYNTLSKVIDKLRRKVQAWDPKKYNCQSFAVDVISALATYPGATRPFLKTLTHDGASLTKAILPPAAAGGLANVWGAISGGILRTFGSGQPAPIWNAWHTYPKELQAHLSTPIHSVRLYYTDAGLTYGVTSHATRLEDYRDRLERMDRFEQKSEFGRFIPRSSDEFDLRDRLR